VFGEGREMRTIPICQKFPKADISLEQPCRGPRKPVNSPQKIGVNEDNDDDNDIYIIPFFQRTL